MDFSVYFGVVTGLAHLPIRKKGGCRSHVPSYAGWARALRVDITDQTKKISSSKLITKEVSHLMPLPYISGPRIFKYSQNVNKGITLSPSLDIYT